MKVLLASSLGGSIKVNGERIPTTFIEENGLLQKIKSIWPDKAKVMIICGSPDNYGKNDSVYDCLKESLSLSGLSLSSFEKCDDRNEEIIERLQDME